MVADLIFDCPGFYSGQQRVRLLAMGTASGEMVGSGNRHDGGGHDSVDDLAFQLLVVTELQLLRELVMNPARM